MNRFHVHVRVEDISRSIAFYSTLFGTAPAVVKDDYAKWMLEDPRVNFAISNRGQSGAGIDHLGIQVDSREELGALAGRLKGAGESTFDQTNTSCCYAKSDKSWVADPSGVRWETFHTFGASTTYGEAEPEALSIMEPVKLESATRESAMAPSACCGAA